MIPGSTAILLSRQALRPCGTTPWVVQTIRAVDFVKENGWRVYSSHGMQTWEMITALASARNVPLRLYASSGGDEQATRDELSQSFRLNPSLVEFAFTDWDHDAGREAQMKERDRRIVEDAEIIIPISIREGGNQWRFLESARAHGKKIVEEFRIGYRLREEPIAYHIDSNTLTADIRGVTSEYVIHWTRASNHAWPGEKLADYYADITRSTRYPGTALDTLRRMVSTRSIMASSRHMPGRTPTVSFSELNPVDVLPLMRWRARYMQMSFEPYGIGIRRGIAEASGVLPVWYYDRKISSAPHGYSAWQTQSIGEKSDWRQEKEYRHHGDFHFEKIRDEDLTLFSHTREEASQLEREFKLRVIPFVD